MPLPKYFTEDDVDRMLDMPTSIDLMQQAFQALADGRAHNVPRVRAKGDGIVLHSMCAAADFLGLVGWKQYTTTKNGARFHVGVYDQSSGELVAMIEANRLGQLRTGAVTGLAAKLMASPDTSEVAVVGTGFQAETQLAAVATALPIRRAFCYGRDAERREQFARRMSESLGIEVVATDSARKAVDSRPIVVTATYSKTPVVEADWLAPGVLVCAVGSNWLNKSELDVETVRRAGAIVCDSIECCQHEAGDFVESLEQNVFDWEQAIELADVVAGRRSAIALDHSLSIFKSVGMAIEDVAMAAKLLELAS